MAQPFAPPKRTHRLLVHTWQDYRLENIPADLLQTIRYEAELRNDSLADVVRRHLCRRYRLNCPPESWNHQPSQHPSMIYLRLQPKLRRHLYTEAQETGATVRSIILTTLDDAYQKETR